MHDSAAPVTVEPAAPTRSSPPHVIALLGVTVIWGTTFAATKVLVGGDDPALTPGALIFLRFAIAAVVFAPLAFGRLRDAGRAGESRRGGARDLWRAGAELSFWLWLGYATQAIGLQYTSVTRSGFVTSLNVVFVPMLVALAGRGVGWSVWIAVVMAVGGAALLSYDGGPPNLGDLWTLGCAVTYAVYIFRLERFARRFDSRALSCIQLIGVAAFSLPWMLGEVAIAGPAGDGAVWGRWSLSVVLGLLYLGVIATLLTTWLQAIGQRGVPGTHASLLYTTEPVFAMAFAIAFFAEPLPGPKGVAGAVLVLLAAAASQWWQSRVARASRP